MAMTVIERPTNSHQDDRDLEGWAEGEQQRTSAVFHQ